MFAGNLTFSAKRSPRVVNKGPPEPVAFEAKGARLEALYFLSLVGRAGEGPASTATK
jgi:hypothetical protein